MSTNIQELYKRLENTRISETADPAAARFQRIDDEQCLCNFIIGITDELMESCTPLAVLYELWGWYCGGTENGVYQYFEQVNKELMDDTADTLRKYGCDEFAEQYINAGKELIPLLCAEGSDNGLIHEISKRYGSYIDDHANGICAAMKKFLLDKKTEICTALDGAEVLTADDKVIHGVPDLDALFADFIDNPLLSEDQRADAAAALERAKKMMNGNI